MTSSSAAGLVEEGELFPGGDCSTLPKAHPQRSGSRPRCLRCHRGVVVKAPEGPACHDRVMRTAGRLVLGVAVALGMLTAACSGSGESEGSDPVDDGFPSELNVSATANLSCFGSTAEPPEDFNRVLDMVALPARPNVRNALQTSAQEATDGTRYYFAKTGLWYRADASFELRVPEDLKPIMAIGWGNPADPAHVINVGCDRSEDWQVLPGGYWVSSPMCARLIMQAGSVEEEVEIGIGKPCEGQGPPQGPSDS